MRVIQGVSRISIDFLIYTTKFDLSLGLETSCWSL